jgi:hypothetical protein
MRDPRVSEVAAVLLREGYVTDEADALYAARRILAVVEEISAQDEERSRSGDAPEPGG